MAYLLLAVIFIAYIGLGIPDSTFGAAWPAIYSDLGLPVENAGMVTVLVYCGTIISSFMSGRVIKKFGTPATTTVSTIITAAALLGFSFSQNMLWFCLLAMPLGLGAGSVDTALNNYVALHYKASHINFLHCSYGVGVSLSPYLMSLALSDSNNWRRGYRVMFTIQVVIALVLIFSTPIWKKVKHFTSEVTEEVVPRTIKLLEGIKIPRAKASIGLLMGSCAIESMCLVWAGTFLSDAKGMTAEKAAATVTFYFIGLTLGRFISGLLASKISSKHIIFIGQSVTLAAVVILLCPVPASVAGAALFMIGLGNGPVFPNMTHLTPKLFGADISQSMIGFEMGFCSISFMFIPFAFGLLTKLIGVWIFPIFLLIMFAVMAISTVALFRKNKNV